MMEIHKIEISSMEEWEGYESFIFRVECNNFVLKRLECKSCSYNRIDYAYFYIINRLYKAGLLEENFEMLCCDCSYIKKILGFTHCLECEGSLQISRETNRGDDIVKIFCEGCGKIHYEKEISKEGIEAESFFVYI